MAALQTPEDFAKALNAPETSLVQRSAALQQAEREKKALCSYIANLEQEQRVLCVHIQQQDAEIARLKRQLELDVVGPPETAERVVDPEAGRASALEARTDGAINLTE